MGLFAVTTHMTNQNGDTVWFPFETDRFPSTHEGLTALRKSLNDGVLEEGFRLKIRREKHTVYELERDPIIIGRPLIAQVTLMREDNLVRM